MRRYDLATALFLLALGLAFVAEARRLTLGTLGQPAPGFFPFYLGLLLSLLALALLGRAWWARGAAAGSEGGGRPRWWKVVATLAALLVYAFALESLGFLATTGLFMLFLFRVVEPRPWPVALGGSVGTVLCAYVLFKWLGVQLPVGAWFR